ncbi:MAG TPA: plastocyanin/azurin family copper-binding protein [Ktedonosporobacter sp.]|nr:plastocyanin/azurin family copper-binding protein [Ktedonosporobacter sp.]
MKKIIFIVVFALTFTIVVACGGAPNAGPTPAQTQDYKVTMGGTTFDTNTITISKGSTITFTSDQGAAHNIIVGSNGQPSTEAGAPDFGAGGQTLSAGKTWTTQPWNTAGTFHVTCTYHPTTMTLTVIVNG